MDMSIAVAVDVSLDDTSQNSGDTNLVAALIYMALMIWMILC